MRNLRLRLWVLVLVMTLWSFSGVAMAKRVALVVGNSAYEHVSPLDNPENDATAMTKALRDLGFEVMMETDLDSRSFVKKLKEFERATEGASAALFFYAGHASQYQGKNYLTPIDATELKDELDYKRHIELNKDVMDSMRSRTRLVFLDACRDNPLDRQFKSRTTGSSSNSRGLARVEWQDNGSYIAYATAPGYLAEDGPPDGNSPFTAALLEHIGTQGISVSDMMIKVRKSVLLETQDKQRPWEASSLLEPFRFSSSEVATSNLPPDPLISPSDPSRSDPGVYLKVGVGAGQEIEESHLEVVAKDRISEGEIGEYSMIRGGCYSGGMSAGTRLGWEHIQSSCTR